VPEVIVGEAVHVWLSQETHVCIFFNSFFSSAFCG